MNISWKYNFCKCDYTGKSRLFFQPTPPERKLSNRIYKFNVNVIVRAGIIWAFSTSSILAQNTSTQLNLPSNSIHYPQLETVKLPKLTSSQIEYENRTSYENCALADSIVFPAAKARADGIPKRTVVIQSEKDREDRLAKNIYAPFQVNAAYTVEIQVLDFVYSTEPVPSPAKAVQLWNDQCASKYHYHPSEDSRPENGSREGIAVGGNTDQESGITHIVCKLQSSRKNDFGNASTLERNYAIDYGLRKVNGADALISDDEIKFNDGIYRATINRYSSTALLISNYGTKWQGSCEIMQRRAF